MNVLGYEHTRRYVTHVRVYELDDDGRPIESKLVLANRKLLVETWVPRASSSAT